MSKFQPGRILSFNSSDKTWRVLSEEPARTKPKRMHPYMCNLKRGKGRRPAYDNIKCPMCHNVPHKAVYLTCSEGCGAVYVCDANYTMSSHCFKKLCDSQSVERPPKKTPGGERPTKFVFPADRRRPSCPAKGCRGTVKSWVVHKPARDAMDAVQRCCRKIGYVVDKTDREAVDAIEGDCNKDGYCDVKGNYTELKDHAKLLHDRSFYISSLAMNTS